jgi:hypothetical protein
LPGDCAPAGDHRGFARALGAPVLGGFLVLGLAMAGCGAKDKSAPDPMKDTGGELSPRAWAEGCKLDEGSSLFVLIDESATLSVDDKAALCDCMAAMPKDWQLGLSEAFKECTPSAIARFLEGFVAKCEAQGGVLTDDPSKEVARPVPNMPVYKGVVFPS